MKKLFVTAIIIMCCATTAILGASSAFCTIEDAGYAVPADAGIAKLLAEEAANLFHWLRFSMTISFILLFRAIMLDPKEIR